MRGSGVGWGGVERWVLLHHDAAASTTAAVRTAIMVVVLTLHNPADAAALGDVGASC